MCVEKGHSGPRGLRTVFQSQRGACRDGKGSEGVWVHWWQWLQWQRNWWGLCHQHLPLPPLPESVRPDLLPPSPSITTLHVGFSLLSRHTCLQVCLPLLSLYVECLSPGFKNHSLSAYNNPPQGRLSTTTIFTIILHSPPWAALILVSLLLLFFLHDLLVTTSGVYVAWL